METRTSEAIHDLESRLHSLKSTLTRTSFVEGVALAVRLACLCLAGAFVVDAWWDAPQFIRVGVLVATLAAVGTIVFLRVIRPLMRRVSNEELAALVESAHPEFEERLLSSLELARSADRDAVKGSPLMREQLMRETVKAAKGVAFDEVVDSSVAVRQSMIASVAFLVVLAPFLVLHDGYGNLWARFFNPWGNHARGMTLTIEVQPGDSTVPRGEDVTISAVPHFRFGAERMMSSPRVTWLDEDGSREFRELKSTGEQNIVAAVIPQVSQGLRYRVESDQGASREFQIRVVERPTMTGLTVDVQPPVYCGRPAQRVDGLVGETTVFERSKLVFSATFNKPVAEVRWLWIEDIRKKYDGKPVEATGADRLKSASVSGMAFAKDDAKLVSVADDGKSATWEMTADREGAFEIVLLDPAGIQNRNEPGRSIRIVRDAAPTVSWADEENHPQAKGDDVVAFQVNAADDIGVGALELHYSVLPHRTQAGVLKADAAQLGALEVEARFPIDLRKLTIPDGSLVAVRARAADERPIPSPNEAWTSERVIVISKDAEAFGASELGQRQQRIRDELSSLRQEAAARESDAAALKQKAREAQTKGNEAFNFKSEAEQLQVKEEQLNERLQQVAAKLQKEGLLANLSPKLNEVAKQDVVPAIQETETAREGAQDAQTTSLQKAERELGEATQHLAQVEQRFEELAKLEKDLLELNRIADKTERLANDVADFEQQKRNQAGDPGAQSDSKQDGQKPSEPMTAMQKDLDSKRQQLQKEQKELSRNLQDVLNRRPEVVEAARADLMQRLKSLGQRAEKLADQEDRLSSALKQSGQENAQALNQQTAEQKQLRDQAEALAAKVAQQERQQLAPTPDLQAATDALKQLEQGNPKAAAQAQREAAEELERLAKALEQNQKLPADPQQAAQALAQRQRELKDQLAKAGEQMKQEQAAQQPGKGDAAKQDKGPPQPSAAVREQIKQLAAEQAAVQVAASKLEVPLSSENRQRDAVKDANRALREALDHQPEKAAQSADRAASSLDQLARDIGPPEEREKKLARDVEQLRKEQGAIAKSLEQQRDEARAAGRKPTDKPEDVPDTLRKQQEQLAKRQQEVMNRAAGVDPSHSPQPAEAGQRQQEALQAAADSLQKTKAGNAEDAAPAARAAERALSDLEHALKNEPSRNDELERLVKEQKQIAEAAREALNKGDAKGIDSARSRQQEQSKKLDRLDAPEAKPLADEAKKLSNDAAQQLAAAKGDANRRPAAEAAVQQAGEALDRLTKELKPQGGSPAEQAQQLAKAQNERAERAAKAVADPQSAPAQPDRAAQNAAMSGLNQVPAGNAAGQKQDTARALQAAADADAKAAEAKRLQPSDATEPSPELKSALADNAAKQQEAADALELLAKQLSEPGTQQQAEATAQSAEKLAARARESRQPNPGQQAQAAQKLAQEQADLRNRTQPLADGTVEKAQQKPQMDAVRGAQQKLAESLESMNGAVNPVAQAEAQQQARAAEKSLAANDPKAAVEQQAAAEKSLQQLARSAEAQSRQDQGESPPPSSQKGQSQQAQSNPKQSQSEQAQASQSQPGQPSQPSVAKEGMPSSPAQSPQNPGSNPGAAGSPDAPDSKPLAQQARELAQALRDSAVDSERQASGLGSQMASANSSQQKSGPSTEANPGQGNSSPPAGTPQDRSPSTGTAATPGQSSQGQGDGPKGSGNSASGTRSTQPGQSSSATGKGDTPMSAKSDGASGSPSSQGTGGQPQESGNAPSGSPATPSGTPPSAAGNAASPMSLNPNGSAPSGQPSKSAGPMGSTPSANGGPMGQSGQSSPMMSGTSPKSDGSASPPSGQNANGSPSGSQPGQPGSTATSPMGGAPQGNSPSGSSPMTSSGQPGTAPSSGQPASPAAGSSGTPSPSREPMGDGQSNGTPSPQPDSPRTPAQSAREAVAKQQQVSSDLAAAALEAAEHAPGTKVSEQASQLSKGAGQTSDAASVGAMPAAAQQGRQLAQEARELAKKLDENPIAKGGSNPELSERLRDVAREQEQASQEMSQLSADRDVRNSAQSQGQRQLQKETQQLEKDFQDLADRLKAQPVDRKRQSEQAADARTRSQQASQEMRQATQKAEQGDSGLASQSAETAAAELRRAAKMAREERGFEPEKNPNNPVPNETGSEVAEAARQLQQAGEILADSKNGSPMPSDGKDGKPGQPSKMDASKQAAQSPKDGQQKGDGQAESDMANDQGLAQGQQEGPPSASEMLKQGAHSLRQAASQMKLRPGENGDQGVAGGEQQGESQPTSSQSKQGSSSGANEQVRIVDVDAHLKKLSTRNWGQLPGKLQTDILQSTRKRPDGDYAPLIRRYFDQISKSQAPSDDRKEE